MVNQILEKSSGIYTGKLVDGTDVVIMRQEGAGFTIKYDQGPDKPYWCEDYDEYGDIECSYPES